MSGTPMFCTASLARTLLLCHLVQEKPSSQFHSVARDTWNEQGSMLVSSQSDILVGWALISVRGILRIISAITDRYLDS